MAAKNPVSNGKLSHYGYRIESKAPGTSKWQLANFGGYGAPLEQHRNGVDPHLPHVAAVLADTMMPTVGGVRMDRLDDPVYRANLQSSDVQAALPHQNLNEHQFRVMRYPVFQEFKPDGTVGATIRTNPVRNPKAGEEVPMPDVTPRPYGETEPSAPSRGMLPIRPHGNTGNPSGNLGKAVGKDPGKNKRARREAAEAAAPKKPAAKKAAPKTAAAPAAKKPATKKPSTVTVTAAQLNKELAKRTGKK